MTPSLVNLASMCVHIGPPAKRSPKTPRVVLPEEIYARVVFGHWLWPFLVVRRLGSFDRRDGLAGHSSGRHERGYRKRKPLLVPRL